MIVPLEKVIRLSHYTPCPHYASGHQYDFCRDRNISYIHATNVQNIRLRASSSASLFLPRVRIFREKSHSLLDTRCLSCFVRSFASSLAGLLITIRRWRKKRRRVVAINVQRSKLRTSTPERRSGTGNTGGRGRAREEDEKERNKIAVRGEETRYFYVFYSHNVCGFTDRDCATRECREVVGWLGKRQKGAVKSTTASGDN